VHIRGRRVSVRNRFTQIFQRDKFRQKAGEASTERATESRKLCPHCGHDEFSLAKSSWWSGQWFQCKKCQGTFKKAEVEVVSKRIKKFSKERR